MKKTLLGLVAVALSATSLTSCGNGGSDTFSKSFSDSLSIFFGRNIGASLNRELATMPAEMRDTFALDDFYKGVQYALNSPEGDAFLAGLNTGLRIKAQIAEWRALGVEFNKEAFLNNLKAYTGADSVPNADQVMMDFNSLQNQVNQRSEAQRLARLENSPEARANVAAGEAYIAQLKAKSPSLAITDDGIAYIITVPGDTAATIGINSMLRLSYVTTLLDGKEVDHGEDISMSPYRMPRGLAQALMMLHPGATGTFYIPGSLAYGPEGVQNLVGPNEMVVFTATVGQILNQ